MIERIAEHFDWVYQMPIESQCRFFVGLSFVGFIVAAFIRETCKHSGLRCLARAIGAASFFAVAAFAYHVSHENEKLNSELMVKRGEKSTDIASERFLSLTTSGGNRFEFGVSKHGVRVGTAGIGRGSSKPAASSNNTQSSSIGFTASRLGFDGGPSAVLDGLNDTHQLSEWWRRVWADADADDAGTASRFESSRAIKGESF